MGKIFVLVTQLRNLTDRRVGFRVDDRYCSLPELPPRKTRMVKLSRILRSFRERGSDWRIRILVDNEFTGIELGSWVVLSYVRLVFRNETDGNGLDVLCVEAVQENCSDYLLRHKYFGCMRNIFWDRRPTEVLAWSDSKLATKLGFRTELVYIGDREIEAYGRDWSDTTLRKRQCLMPKVDKHEENPTEGKRESDQSLVCPATDKNGEMKSQPNSTVVVRQKESTIHSPSPSRVKSGGRRSVDTENHSTHINDEFSTNTPDIGKEGNTAPVKKIGSHEWISFCAVDKNDEIRSQPKIVAEAFSQEEPMIIPLPPPAPTRGWSIDTEDSSSDTSDESLDDKSSNSTRDILREIENITTALDDKSSDSTRIILEEIEKHRNVTTAVQQVPGTIPVSPSSEMRYKGREPRTITVPPLQKMRNRGQELRTMPVPPPPEMRSRGEKYSRTISIPSPPKLRSVGTEYSSADKADDDELSTNARNIHNESNTIFNTWDYFFAPDVVQQEPARTIHLLRSPRMGSNKQRSVGTEYSSMDIANDSSDDEPSTNSRRIVKESNTPFPTVDEIQGQPNVTAAPRQEPRTIPLPLPPRMRSCRSRSVDSEDSSTDIADKSSSNDHEPSTNTNKESYTPLNQRKSAWMSDYYFLPPAQIEGQPIVTPQEPRTISSPPPPIIGSRGRRSVDTDEDYSKDISDESSNNESTADIRTTFSDQSLYSFAVNKNDEFIESRPNVIQQAVQQEPRTVPEPPWPEMKSRGQGSYADTKRSFPKSSSNIVQEVNTPVEREIGSHIRVERSRREQLINQNPGHLGSFLREIPWVFAVIFVWILLHSFFDGIFATWEQRYN